MRHEYDRFVVWSYVRPSGHSKSSGFLRGTSAPITEWAFALVDESARPLVVYMESSPKSGFPSLDTAMIAARQTDWSLALPDDAPQGCTEHGDAPAWQWRKAGGCPTCVSNFRANDSAAARKGK